MPHVAFVPMTGFRVREAEMLALGMKMPGLRARAGAIGRLPALGLLTVAAHTPDHWSISWHEADGSNEARLIDELCRLAPDAVAISALTASIESARRLSRRLRDFGIPVVIGGLHATAAPDDLTGHFDAVAVGEGELIWSRMLADLERGNLEKIYRTGQRFDLARSRLPRYDLLGDELRPRYTLQTERGCPLACDFCAAGRLLGPFREKPIDRIRAELAAITARQPRPTIELADDNTFAGGRDFEPLFQVLADSGARYFTEADWRFGLRPELLRGLAASGCVQVLVGIESLGFRHRGMGAKQADPVQIMEAVEAVQQAGIAVLGCFIIGSDGETRESIDRLVTFLLESPLADVQLTVQTPFPGTLLHRDLARAGRLLPDRGWSAYTLFDVAFQPDRLTVAELERAFSEAVQAVFAPGPAARREKIRREIMKRRRA